MLSAPQVINPILASWLRLDVSWRWGIGGVIIARLLFGLWAFAILTIFPLAVQNLNFPGNPVVTIFNLRTNQADIFERTVGGQVLTFRPAGPAALADLQTGSCWELPGGRAVTGSLTGADLPPSRLTGEDIFPYQDVAAYPVPWLAVWQRFDANWFLKIAEHGYSMEDGSTAYFPLYPALIRLSGGVIGDTFLASLLVSTISLFFALQLFYKVVSEYSNAEIAFRAAIFLLVFPVAFFFFAGYTESIYFAFVLAAFLYARRKRWWMAAIFGTLAALTRGTGILLFVPLLYMWWSHSRTRRRQDIVALLFIPSGAGLYLLLTGLSTFSSYHTSWQSRFAYPWEQFSEFWMLIVNRVVAPVDFLNLIVTLLFGILCIFIWRELPRELGLYSVLMFFLPLFKINPGQPFVSMARYLLVLFPAFILLGKWGKKAWVNRAILYSSFPAGLYFSAQFWMWGWVG